MKAIASNGVEINTGDPILVRDNNNENWRYAHFSHRVNKEEFYYSYISSYGCSYQCIPYEGNEHLVGTKNSYESYTKRQEKWIKENNIKVGDKVRITKKSFTGDNGWDVYWSNIMDDAVNKIGTITDISTNGIEISTENLEDFWYPYHILEKVENRFEFKFGAKVRAVCEDNTVVEGILIRYIPSIHIPYGIAINRKSNFDSFGDYEWVESIEYIE